MESSQQKANTEPTNSDKVASLPGNDEERFERERMLSLLCQEELSSPLLHASSNAATALSKRTENQSRSSSSAGASIMEYSLATNMSEEISRLIFCGERRGGPRRRRQLKRQKSDEDQKPPSLPFAPDNPISRPIFPEIPRGQNLPMPINVSPKFGFLRPVTPEQQGRLNKALLEPTTSQSGSPSIFRRNTVTPADVETMGAMQDTKKRKASQSPGRADTDLQLRLRSPPQQPNGESLGDIIDTATKMLSAMRATSSASGSTSTAQASLRSTSSTFTSTTTGHPQGQPSMAPKSPVNTQPMQAQPQDLEKLQLTPMSHYLQQQEPSMEKEEKGLFDDVFADDQDDALPDCSLDLMNAKDLEPDTSIYMCARDPDASDIPTEISTENLERQPSRQLPWFPSTGTRQVMASQSSSALYFGDRNGGIPLAHNNNNLLNLQQPQQPLAPPALANNNQEPTTYYGRKTRAPLIDDDEPEEEIKINLAEFFEQVERQSRASSTLERETSSLFTNPPPPSPRRQQGVRMARTESITDGDTDIGGLLSHQLLPSPKHSNKNLRYSSSM